MNIILEKEFKGKMYELVENGDSGDEWRKCVFNKDGENCTKIGTECMKATFSYWRLKKESTTQNK